MKSSSTWLAAAAVVAVLALGAVESWAVLFLECAVAAIALAEFWNTRRIAGGSRTVGILLTILGIWPILQLVPLPRAALSFIAPARVAAYGGVLGPWNLASEHIPISVQSYATAEGSIRFLAYLLVFLLAFGWERRRSPNALTGLLIALGLFEAVYGLIQYLTGFPYIFNYVKRDYLGDATGTFINHNHYAGFMEMVLPFLLAAVLFPPESLRPRGPRWAVLFTDESFGALRRLAGFAVIALALFFSRSRMGIISAVVTLGLIAVLATMRRGRKSWPALALVLALPLIYVLWVGATPVSERFGALGAGGDEVRLDFWKDALSQIRQNPLVGSGLGTYFYVNPHYQTHFFQWRIDHPHNDYLEWAADLGIPAALLLFGSLWWITLRLALRVRTIERRSDLLLAVGCCGALCSLLVHSLADFNTQIPANAIMLAWIAGTGAGLLKRLQEVR